VRFWIVCWETNGGKEGERGGRGITSLYSSLFAGGDDLSFSMLTKGFWAVFSLPRLPLHLEAHQIENPQIIFFAHLHLMPCFRILSLLIHILARITDHFSLDLNHRRPLNPIIGYLSYQIATSMLKIDLVEHIFSYFKKEQLQYEGERGL
jgi:hypothetical protein